MVGWHHQLNGHEFEQTPGNTEDKEAWCALYTFSTCTWPRRAQALEQSDQVQAAVRWTLTQDTDLIQDSHQPSGEYIVSFFYKGRTMLGEV